MRLASVIAAVTATTFSSVATAQTERDLDSHEHGSATLNIAVDNSTVHLELDTPWNNLTGFEHAPRTEEQHALVEGAFTLLNQPAQLFEFVGGSCTPDEIALESGIEAGDADHHDHSDEEEHHKDEHDDEDGHGDKHHDEDGHGDEDHHKDEHGDKDHDEDGHGDEDHHKDEHDDKDHDADGHGDDDHKDEHDHDEHHAEHGEEGDTHSSLLATYSFDCKDIELLTAIDVKVLELWSGFDDLDVQLVGPGGQALVELDPGRSTVDITQVK